MFDNTKVYIYFGSRNYACVQVTCVDIGSSLLFDKLGLYT